jgi:2-polyprenyl-3-methyl-5-hydroxy-6-metoxy-1,4-benzoquinol methylase
VISSPSQQDYQSWADAARYRLQGWFPTDQKDTPILDIGCGSGNLLYLLGQSGYTNCTGVDIGTEQTKVAQKWCPQAHIIQGDVRPVLQRTPDHFGLIAALDVIEHFHKHEIIPLLALIARALRPGGRLILQTPNAESPWFGSVAYSDFTHEWFFTPRGLHDVLLQAGFTNYQARPSEPVIAGYKLSRFVRFITWKCIHTLLGIWNLAETGSAGSGIYTRVFVATAMKEGT